MMTSGAKNGEQNKLNVAVDQLPIMVVMILSGLENWGCVTRLLMLTRKYPGFKQEETALEKIVQ